MYILWWVIALVVVWIAGSYNSLVSLRTRVKEALSDIDVQLKRRFDLIPNLMETVKGYMAHEAGVLEKVTEARASVAGNKGNPLDREKAENALSGTLKTLFAVSENYPDLKANASFLQLQSRISGLENEISDRREFFSESVNIYNIRIQQMPDVFVANSLGYTRRSMLEIPKEETTDVKVQF